MDAVLSGQDVLFNRFFDILRNFPFRITYTSALTGYSIDDEKDTL